MWQSMGWKSATQLSDLKKKKDGGAEAWIRKALEPS